MILGVGIDLVESGRFLDWSPFKKSRIFTKKELDYAALQPAGGEKHLANCWAAREAFLKALGTGFGDDIQFSDVSVSREELGRPEIILAGGAKAAFKMKTQNGTPHIHLSLTDQGEYSAAVVVIEVSN
ncbi:MAG: holo-ACP synthase [Rickettsiales bacterium]|jgi:holo-[acyl-carrier protein] synthase|nr:holo-ACP synthase [Rickettsiales bacterium]